MLCWLMEWKPQSARACREAGFIARCTVGDAHGGWAQTAHCAYQSGTLSEKQVQIARVMMIEQPCTALCTVLVEGVVRGLLASGVCGYAMIQWCVHVGCNSRCAHLMHYTHTAYRNHSGSTSARGIRARTLCGQLCGVQQLEAVAWLARAGGKQACTRFRAFKKKCRGLPEVGVPKGPAGAWAHSFMHVCEQPLATKK